MQSLLTKNKNYFLFTGIIILIGILAGVLYFQLLNNDVHERIKETIVSLNYFKSNAILKDLIIMAIILVLTFFIIGVPLGIFFIFYESVTMGFIISVFFSIYKIKGLVFAILYLLITRLLTLILVVIFIKKIINIGRYIIGFLIYKKDEIIKEKILLNFRNSLYIIIFVLIINIILYFSSSYILKPLFFIIK